MTETTLACPKCGSGMVHRTGQFGAFYGCTQFRQGCRGTRPGDQEALKNAGPRVPLIGSPEQVAIWDYIQTGTGHLIVEALAGCGKSTTCREALHKIDTRLRTLYVAFNKEIVTEFKRSAPQSVTISTLNGIGWAQVKRAFPKATISEFKIADIIDDVYSPTVEEFESQDLIKSAVKKLVGLCQGALVSGTEPEALLELVCRYDVELPVGFEERVFKVVPEVLRRAKATTSVICFDDQIWLPVVLELDCEKFDLIFVDEAQDLNSAQHQLVLRLLAPGGRVVVVGDVNQAIYGFRGSDAESIPNFKGLLAATGKNVKTLPLTVTRRCGKSIVEVAQEFVPQFAAHESNGPGLVSEVPFDTAVGLPVPGDLVLCRLNAPLAGIAYGLIKRGVKAVIRGRDIGGGLIALLNRIKPRSLPDLDPKLEKWTNKEVDKAGPRRAEAVRQSCEDRAGCIKAMAEGCSNLTELKARIEQVFSNFEADGAPKNAVILSSIHRAKGLEADRVFWLFPEKSCKVKQEWQAQQERNLKYVAITRAKKQLVMIPEPPKKEGK